MFLVFNKEKVCAYIVSVVTVCFLFFISNVSPDKTVQTSSNTNLINGNNSINTNITNNIVNRGD